jgi:hypothetical protein
MATDEKLALDGIEIPIPPGWHSEAFVAPSGLRVYRIGSFDFPRDDTDDVGQGARRAMNGNDVLINIIDFSFVDQGAGKNVAGYESVSRLYPVHAADAIQQEGYSVQAAVVRGVEFKGRKLHVSVAFGNADVSHAQTSAANDVLSALNVV